MTDVHQKKMSVWDNTVRASNLFTYKNLSEERIGGGGEAGSAKETRLEETFTFILKKQTIHS